MQFSVPDMKASALAAFASQLRSWRLHLGWTQVEMGIKLGYSASLISGIETMDKAPTVDFAARCDELFHTPGTFATLQELVAREAYPAFFAPVIPFEREAVRIHGWELGAVPGLLQTEDYARALISSGRPMDTAEQIDQLVAARLERQEVITGENPPLLWFVLDESVVRHIVGGPSVMGGQLDRLLEASAGPGILLQVLPYAADNHAGADGPISLYEFADSPSVCYTECYGGGRIVESRGEVADLMTVINLIRAAALPERASRALIHQIRSEIHDLQQPGLG
ncbi:MAG TPA: helix-turn-helix transcriptional regulator [Trebonia sp.]|jgi:transcriptional regulator with XRE-family HTH domain|nr:helix-turn-helix transcriptional regulator [Trebonia sp.]